VILTANSETFRGRMFGYCLKIGNDRHQTNPYLLTIRDVPISRFEVFNCKERLERTNTNTTPCFFLGGGRWLLATFTALLQLEMSAVGSRNMFYI
jgi:hypothetical protein